MTLYNETFAVRIAPRATTLMAKKTVEWWKGERLRELRTRKKLSQGKLAKVLDVSSQAISNWERSIEAPSSERIAQLCKLFSSSADYFLGFVDQPFKFSEMEMLAPRDRLVLDLFHAGKLDGPLIDAYLAQLESGEDNPRLIENKTAGKSS